MSHATQRVFVAIETKSKTYHADRNCQNIPKRIRERDKDTIKDHYHACSLCVDGAEPSADAKKKNVYECRDCGNRKEILSKAVRKLHPCRRCSDITSFEKHE